MSELSDPRPLIGVTAGNRRDLRGLPGVGVNRAYVSALQAAGADVVLLPPAPAGPDPDVPPVAPALLDRLDGVLLPGGLDLNPQRYGERPRDGIGEVDDDLDALELPLVRAAVARGIPVLGICRGQQVVNVALGGSLYQDLARDGVSDLPHMAERENGRDFIAHPIEVAEGTLLAATLGAGTLEVNSFHHQAVRRLAPGLRVSAVSPIDGVIEGLESEDGIVLAVQCHPEELTAHAWAGALFRSFVVRAAGLARRPAGRWDR